MLPAHPPHARGHSSLGAEHGEERSLRTDLLRIVVAWSEGSVSRMRVLHRSSDGVWFACRTNGGNNETWPRLHDHTAKARPQMVTRYKRYKCNVRLNTRARGVGWRVSRSALSPRGDRCQLRLVSVSS